MPATHGHRVSLGAHDLSWETPDGTSILSHLSFVLGPLRTGLVEPNGVGKTTLLELLVGRRRPTTGHLERLGRLEYLPQSFEVHATQTVAEMLGIADRLEALQRLEAGGYDSGLEALIGDDWDIAERADAVLEQCGLEGLALDRSLGTLSGGETTRVVLASRLLSRPDFLILDEPTNNLDQGSREALHALLEQWRGGLLVVSHDREMLEHVDQILELSAGGLKRYGGNYSDYQQQRAQEEEAVQRHLTEAEQQLRRDRREAQASQERQSRRSAQGKRDREKGGLPKILLNARRGGAQRTSSHLKAVHAQRVEELSGGERMRAALACVLAGEPPPQLLELVPERGVQRLRIDRDVQHIGTAAHPTVLHIDLFTAALQLEQGLVALSTAGTGVLDGHHPTQQPVNERVFPLRLLPGCAFVIFSIHDVPPLERIGVHAAPWLLDPRLLDTRVIEGILQRRRAGRGEPSIFRVDPHRSAILPHRSGVPTGVQPPDIQVNMVFIPSHQTPPDRTIERLPRPHRAREPSTLKSEIPVLSPEIDNGTLPCKGEARQAMPGSIDQALPVCPG